MRTAYVTFKGISPYSQSAHYIVPKLEGETHASYEERTWRERLHVNNSDIVQIPPMALKNCLSEAAKFLSMPVVGKGKATWTKNFEAGVLFLEPVLLGVRKQDVPGEWLFVPSDGRRGGNTRVSKCFPVIHNWGGTGVPCQVIDESLPPDIFELHMRKAGLLIGIGRFRPRNNGYYGRFNVESVRWSNEA